MLSYAFRILKEKGYKNLETEPFDNVADLFAAIILRGVSLQLKQGLTREYIDEKDELTTIRGKIEMSESVKTLSLVRKRLVCSYDDYSSNSYMNRIIKTTMVLMLHSDISNERKKELRKLLVFLGDIELLELRTINWNFQYSRNNQTYRLLISICYLFIKGLLQVNSNGNIKTMDFIDDQSMSKLYEKFILEYYRKEFAGELLVDASQISWAIDDGKKEMLPNMRTDVLLTHGNKILIIDAKYYTHAMQSNHGKLSIFSGNLYQIFTYVKNHQINVDKGAEVAGMLLYAKTDEETFPNGDYKMSGNLISAKTLNLYADFSSIKTQLDGFVDEYFSIKRRSN